MGVSVMTITRWERSGRLPVATGGKDPAYGVWRSWYHPEDVLAAAATPVLITLEQRQEWGRLGGRGNRRKNRRRR